VKRPTSHTIIAVVLGLTGVCGLSPGIWSSSAALPFPLSSTARALIIGTSLAALVAAVGIWGVRPWGRRSYVIWAVLTLATTVYFQLYVMPEMLAFVGEQIGVTDLKASPVVEGVALLIHAGFLWLGYWYLRPRAPATSETPA